MSKWLTTGQMIDQLREGQIAEAQVGWKVSLSLKELRYVQDSGDVDLEKGHYGYVLSNQAVLEIKWRILPQYVPFSEAMKAVEEGYHVECHYRDLKIRVDSWNGRVGAICRGKSCEGGGGASILIVWIKAGKWLVIKEEENETN